MNYSARAEFLARAGCRRVEAGGSNAVGRDELAEEPGAREGPVSFGGAADDAQGGGCLVEREPGVEAELDEFRPAGVDLCEPAEGVVEVNEIVGRGVVGDDAVEVVPPAA